MSPTKPAAKSAAKPGTKKAAAKPSVKKPAAKPHSQLIKQKPSTTGPKTVKASVDRRFGGMTYKPNDKGIVIRDGDNTQAAVKPTLLQKGISSAKDEIANCVKELTKILTTDLEIIEIDFTLSFSAEGKFLGIGASGATSVSIKVKPL